MAKQRKNTSADSERQTRKDILIARKQAEQTRQIKMAVYLVAGLLGLLLIVAIVNELIIAPGRAVANVNGEKIALNDWQDRVEYERAQRIILLENQYDAFGGDVGIIQQFAGQYIMELLDAEAFAEGVLDQMIDEAAARQLAEGRGISVSDADVESEIGASFSYYGGASPTSVPQPTAAPSESEEPAATPRPTATPVSEESYNEQYNEVVQQFKDLGVDADLFRESTRNQLIQTRLMDALAADSELATEAEQATVSLIVFNDEESANEAMALINDSDYMEVWDTLRTAPDDLEITGTASEITWRTREDMVATFGESIADTIFSQELNVTTDILASGDDPETARYYIMHVTGREVRPLSESVLQQKKFEILTSAIDVALTGNVETFEFWRSRVPSVPTLDPKFLAQPTPAPDQPETQPETQPEPTTGTE